MKNVNFQFAQKLYSSENKTINSIFFCKILRKFLLVSFQLQKARDRGDLSSCHAIELTALLHIEELIA